MTITTGYGPHDLQQAFDLLALGQSGNADSLRSALAAATATPAATQALALAFVAAWELRPVQVGEDIATAAVQVSLGGPLSALYAGLLAAPAPKRRRRRMRRRK